MAFTSASSIQKMTFKYDVFISFSGEDTRRNFVDNLYLALMRNGIYTYRDDEETPKGRGINDELMRSIENSRYYVVVFSKNYASSSWCLNELVKIMECEKTGGHIAYPVFYDVEPTEVRKQSGAVEKAFEKHKEEEGAEKWREALRQAAELAGWELKNTCDGHEGKLIQKIVQAISLELRFTNFSVDEKLVGMGTRVKEVISSLEIGSDDVRFIGFKGMGGAGKTTLARAVFDQISFWFEGSSFVENVRERSKDSSRGLNSLQEQVISDVLKTKDITTSGVYDGIDTMKRRMCGIKVLVVLDDVDHRKQLQALAGRPEWFKSGSRIVITTRDEQVLIAHGVPRHLIFDAKLLSYKEAICLLSRYAFGREAPNQGYEKLSDQVIHYASGLPLTIEVLGSNLCGKDELEWTDELERLKKIPLQETQEILELSFNSLEEEHKEIFLDVACMLKGCEKEEAIRVLECRLFHARYGLRVLELKSLITVSHNGFLGMHDHIEEMGKNIVRRAHPGVPYKHSRLWIEEDIKNMLDEDKDNEETRCIQVHTIEPAIIMKVLRKMKKLSYLDVTCIKQAKFKIKKKRHLPHLAHGSQFIQGCSVYNYDPDAGHSSSFTIHPNLQHGLQYRQSTAYKFDFDSDSDSDSDVNCSPFFADPSSADLDYNDIGEDSLYLPHGLQYLRWEGYPFTCLPKDFQANNLVGLNMRSGDMDQLWEVGERKVLKQLRFIDLFRCKLKSLDVGLIPNLERLSLVLCDKLVELSQPNSKLKYLNLCGSGLRTLNLERARDLDTLKVQACHNLTELCMPVECLKLKHLKVHSSMLKTVNLTQALNLETLHLECDDLVELHVPKNFKLKSLTLCRSKLKTVDIGPAQHLDELCIKENNNMVELHFHDEKLQHLQLLHCPIKTLNLKRARNLEKLDISQCWVLQELHMPIESLELETVQVNGSRLRTLDLAQTRNLKRLNLSRCVNLIALQMPIESPNLKEITLNCSELKTLDLYGTRNLKSLHLEKCNDLLELHMPKETLEIETIKVHCSKLPKLDLARTQNLKKLHLFQCDDLVEFHMPNECLELEIVKVRYSKLPTLDLSETRNLKKLHLGKCNDLLELHLPNETPKLETIKVQYCSKLPTLDLSGARNLKTLDLEQCDDLLELHMPNDCPGLKTIKVQYCSKLPTVDLSGTRNLKRLDLDQCDDLLELHMPNETPELETINMHCSKLKTFKLGISPHLECLNLRGCFTLEKISALVGCLSGQVIFKPILVNEGFPMVNSLPELHIISSPIGLCPLHPHNNLPKFHYQCTYKERLPASTENLKKLISFGLCACTNLAGLSGTICGLQCLRKLTLEGSIPELPKEIDQLECLEELTLLSTEIEYLPDSICTLNHLKFLRFESCFFFKQLPENIGRLECLEELTLLSIKIEYLPDSICTLNHLKILRLESCCFLKQLPEKIGILECLEDLTLLSIKIEYLPDSICTLNHLKFLRLESCCFLKQLPENIGRLECLEELHLTDCTSLRDIPNSICEMKRLNSIHLRNCILVEKLPKDIGRLKCLEQLHIKGSGITDLPESIYQLEDLQFFV